MIRKIISLIPFLIICGIVIHTWVEFITTDYIATWRHYLALIAVAINAALYFVRYKQALLLTGLILILATFNLLSFFYDIKTWVFGIGPLRTLPMELKSLLLLVIYCLVNFNFLINWYLDKKQEKARKRV